MKRRVLFILFSLLIISGFAQNSCYVSEYGNDVSGDGSQNLPWATITKALSESSTINGDTIHVTGIITQNGLNAEGINILKDVIIKGDSKETSIVQVS